MFVGNLGRCWQRDCVWRKYGFKRTEGTKELRTLFIIVFTDWGLVTPNMKHAPPPPPKKYKITEDFFIKCNGFSGGKILSGRVILECTLRDCLRRTDWHRNSLQITKTRVSSWLNMNFLEHVNNHGLLNWRSVCIITVILQRSIKLIACLKP
jgi:hypothetical protein